MIKNKKIIITILALGTLSMTSANAKVAFSDLVLPKSPAYRVGVSDIPENQYVEATENKKPETSNTPRLGDTTEQNVDILYSELNIKRLSKEVAQDLEYEEQDMVSDLTLLWQGAAMQSDTINFALYKLANPDADKPDKKSIKKVLQTIASVSTIAGAGMGNPLLAGTSLIGGNILGIMSQDTKSLNYKYTKVNDADMIILIRKVEDLQQNAVNLYYDYMCAKKQYDMTTKLLEDRRIRFENAQKNNVSRELVVITDAYYRTAMDKQKNARSEFLSKRAALEQFVGNEAFTQFENDLAEREKAQNENNNNTEQSSEYKQTVKAVENYTEKLADNSYNQPSENPYIRAAQDYGYDPNLDKLPAMEPLNTMNEKVNNTAQTTANQVKNTTETTIKQTEDTKKKVKKTREEKLAEKYSTKGLIFLHSERQQPKEETLTDVLKTVAEDRKSSKSKKSKDKKNNAKTPETSPAGQVQQVSKPNTNKNNYNGVELLPLDEIKAPDTHRKGYSIFAE